MIPTYGVVTAASEAQSVLVQFSITVCGITKAEVDNYRELLKSHGMSESGNGSMYKNDNVEIGLGTSGVETTKDSELYITIQKP